MEPSNPAAHNSALQMRYRARVLACMHACIHYIHVHAYTTYASGTRQDLAAPAGLEPPRRLHQNELHQNGLHQNALHQNGLIDAAFWRLVDSCQVLNLLFHCPCAVCNQDESAGRAICSVNEGRVMW